MTCSSSLSWVEFPGYLAITMKERKPLVAEKVPGLFRFCVHYRNLLQIPSFFFFQCWCLKVKLQVCNISITQFQALQHITHYQPHKFEFKKIIKKKMLLKIYCQGEKKSLSFTQIFCIWCLSTFTVTTCSQKYVQIKQFTGHYNDLGMAFPMITIFHSYFTVLVTRTCMFTSLTREISKTWKE